MYPSRYSLKLIQCWILLSIRFASHRCEFLSRLSKTVICHFVVSICTCVCGPVTEGCFQHLSPPLGHGIHIVTEGGDFVQVLKLIFKA